MVVPMTPLPKGSLVYRAIRSKSWKEGDKAKDAAFYLRIDKPDSKPDEEDLSVFFEIDCEIGVKCSANANRCFGAFVLRVDEIRKFGLEVIYTPELDKPFHASITKVPKRKGNTKDLAVEIAENLAQESRIHHHADWKGTLSLK